MSRKVYVVNTGCYSDWSIRGIFSTRENAEKYMANCRAAGDECWHKDDFNEIAVYSLDGGLEEKTFRQFGCSIWLDSGDECEREKSWERPQWGIEETTSYVAEHVPLYDGRGVVRVQSHKSAAHALKVAAEKRQEWLRSRP